MEIRRFNDKLNVPIGLLTKLGINKGDYVTFEQEGDFIIIEKCHLDKKEAEKLYKNQIKLANKISKLKPDLTMIVKSAKIEKGNMILTAQNDEEIQLPIEQQKDNMHTNLHFKMKTSKRNELTIPSTIFNGLNLAGKKYIAIATRHIKDNKLTIRITPNENGKHTFRKSNVLSINELGKLYRFKVEPNTQADIEYRSEYKNIDIIFKYDEIEDLAKEYKAPSLSDPIKEKTQPIPTYYETTDIQMTPEDKAKLQTIKETIEHSKQISEQIDKMKQPKQSVTDATGDLTKYNKPITVLPGSNRNITEAEIQEQNLNRLEQIYNKMQKEAKQSTAYIKFIDKKDLPKNQTNCYICGTKLTDADDSMVSNKRVCKQCKHIELDRFFQPIRQMAKVKQKINQIKSESETTGNKTSK